jgi:hypothetical protein
MSTQTKSEYMLLFRGTDWHKGLSPEEIQEVVKQMYAWLDRLTAEGKAKAGKPPWFILKWKLSRFRFALVIASLAGVTLDRRMRL